MEKLQQLKEEETVLDVTVKGIVKSGVVAYVEGVRGFIPASKLSLHYVENLEEYLNQLIQVRVFEVDKEKKRLILSAKRFSEKKRRKREKQKYQMYRLGW